MPPQLGSRDGSRALPSAHGRHGIACRSWCCQDRLAAGAGHNESRGSPMGKLLVHITCGPEAPTRAALGLLVARAAIEGGHEVSVFLAGDGVQLIREPVLDSLNGLG